MTSKIRPLNFRFFANVLSSDKCWFWRGAVNADGYGSIGDERCRNGLRAHRVVYQMVYGKIPKGLSVLHSCDVRRCVNPLHLWLGTQADNMRDAALKGRIVAPKGEYHPKSVFTWSFVRKMRSLYARGVTQVEIAKRFHTRQGTIGRILRNEGWVEAKTNERDMKKMPNEYKKNIPKS
jgi:hypothetical protein